MKMKSLLCMMLMIVCVGLSQAGTIVQWGNPGGDTGIVATQQNGANFTKTYSETSVKSPAVGAAYYSNNTGRTQSCSAR
jgi:hypothetical protein